MLGLVTIGQSPREDVLASMFGDRVPCQVLEAGALDYLDSASIDDLRPEQGEQPLVTRLRDGREVVIGKPRLIPHLKRAVLRVEAAGCETVCVLCTGEFPELGRSSLIVYPDRVLVHLIEAVLPTGTLGVVIPHPGQHDGMVKKWTTATRNAITVVASPYSAADQIAGEVQCLVHGGADIIVLDCMGFDRRMLSDARSATSKPVVLSNGIVGSVLIELIGNSVGIGDHTD